jgi:soluble lytic murein transglycosylase-like protein
MTILVSALLLAAASAVTAGEASGVSASSSAPVAFDRGSLRQLVAEVSREHGLDPALIDALVRVESDYNPVAVSRKGARGLMQLMPATAARLNVADVFDPEQNVRGGVREFARLVDQYAGSLPLALAAYNAGEGAVAIHRGIPPFTETRDYVRRILTMYTGRPYVLPGSRLARPVRMLRDPGSGQTVITNVGSSAAASAVASTGRAAVLGGGFGQTGD